MRTMSTDTSVAAENVQLNLLRAAPAWRKLAMVWNLNHALKGLILADLEERFPDDDRDMRHRRLAHRWLGPTLARAAYGAVDEA